MTSLDSRASQLAAFVPRLALELSAGGVPSWTSLEGSMLSADISGFTALSEKLAGKGKAGAEEITGLINTCFTALIDAAYQYGGEVVKFGGDAVLVIFRGSNHQRRAADAGLAMQRALVGSAAARRAHLSMTVGVAEGPFDAFLVGSEYRELFVCGPRATEVIRLEAAAEKGDTLVSASIAAHLPASMSGAHHHDGVIIAGSTGDAPTGPDERLHTSEPLEPFVPARVQEQLDAFSGHGGEHRLVTVGFVMITGVSSALDRTGAEQVAHDLGHVVDEVVAACEQHGVTLLHSDIAGDGVKLVLCAGAPLNSGDSADAMLQAALRVAAIDAPFVIRQGVQSGRVFAGFLGSEHRKTYTLMGDPVNTAARMLGKAGDREVVAVGTVLDGTRTVYVTDELEPFLVKGKSEPIVAHTVRAVTDVVRRDGLFVGLVGRQREQEVLTLAVQTLGAAVEVVGGAGVGKSRLLDATREVARGIPIFESSCTPYGAASPYSVFRPLLRGAVGIPLDATAESVGQRLVEHIERHAPQLTPMLPLLAVPFGGQVSDTPESAAIDPEFRRMKIHDVVVDYLDTFLTDAALLIVEDAQWIDDASGELVNQLARVCKDRPWSIVVTRRPGGMWALAELDEHVTRLELHPLTDDSIRSIAIEVSTRPLLDRDLDAIADKAQGNPLFAIELARTFTGEPGDLPDSVEQIIARRIDELSPAARRLVRVASVLGNRFDENVVDHMLANDDASIVTAEALADAVDAGAVRRRSNAIWAFDHALYRDAAYEGLPFNRRKHLHRLAATILEEQAAQPNAIAQILSLHYSVARMHDKAWQYSVIAAEAAIAQQATIEAAVAYERALAAARYCSHVAASDRGTVAEALGDLYYELGRLNEAARVYTQARRASTDPVGAVRLVRKLGSVADRQGDPGRGLRWYARATRAIPADTNDAQWFAAKADIALYEASIRAMRNENERCLEIAHQAHVDATRAGDPRLQALALERMQLAIAYLDQPDVEGVGPQALAAYRDLGDNSGMARILANMGIEAYFASDWSTASSYYLEALEVASRSGNVVQAATAAINNAEILSDQGSWSTAIDLCESALRNYEAVGYSAGIAAANLFAGVAAMRNGELESAHGRLATARPQLLALGMADMLTELDSRELELRVKTGTATIADCISLAERVAGDDVMVSRVLRARAIIELRSGIDPEPTLLEALRLTPSAGFERALTLHALATMVPDPTRAPKWRDEADHTFGSLGVHTPPPVL
ncbi:MAG: AAA family ATPase [Actinobacteria bacterium]|nr:AAA family ATPase [Actinomycetota bacterium]